MTPDQINGLYELAGAGVVTASVVRLYRDRRVMGIDWRQPAFFTSWGLWNLFYYPSLGQWYSFAGDALLAVANLAWVALYLYWINYDRSRNG